jgi:hypothetical protein
MDTNIKDFFNEICLENGIQEYECAPALKM